MKYDNNALDAFISDYEVSRKGTYLIVRGREYRKNLNFQLGDVIEISHKYKFHVTNSFAEDLFAEVHRRLAETIVKQSVAPKISTASKYVANFNLETLQILAPVNSDQREIYIDTETNEVLNVTNHKRTIEILRNHFSAKDFADWRREHIVPVFVGFNPEETDLCYKVGHQNYYNLYKAPPWRFAQDTGNLPEEYTELMVHLFPEDDSREIVERWLHDAVFYRARTHLLLHGYKGTGKTTLAQLALALVGESNAHTASSAQIESSFDSSLANRVLYFWDEVSFDKPRAKNKFKKYINSKFALDQKFKDSHQVEKIFASHILCNNSKTDCLLEVDDRVFTVPNITKKPLLQIWKAEKIANFIEKLIKNDSYLAEIGYYLKKTYGGKGLASPQKTFISENYIELVNSTIKPFYKRCFIELCYEKAEFDISMVRDATKVYLKNKSPVSLPKVEQFARDYKMYLGIDLVERHSRPGTWKSLVFEKQGEDRGLKSERPRLGE